MPELPEVETIVRDLAPRVEGRTLSRPRVIRPDVLRGVSTRRLLETLRRNPVVRLRRRAKHAVFELRSGDRIVVQPRMTGSLLIYERPLKESDRRYAVFRAGLDRGVTLVVRDVRRLGTISLLSERQWRRYSDSMGPEPLDPDLTPEHFHDLIRRSSQAIKKVIMDQKRIVGIGNIYANEALWSAGIDPSMPARDLPLERSARLLRAAQEILKRAIESRGTTLRDYRTGTGDRGEFQRLLRVYGRGGEACDRCGTKLATTHEIDRRSTTFCWRCQRK